jgi:RecA-family ATPase
VSVTDVFVTVEDYLKFPREPQPWIVDQLIPTSGMVNIYGKPKSHKSFLSAGLAHAVSQGLPEWEGFKILRHGPVAYLQVDTPREEWARRLLSLNYPNKDNFFVADMWLTPEFPFNILNPLKTEVKWLAEEMQRIKPIMVVLDTLRDIHSGDENDNTTMRNVLVELVAACRPATIVIVSHSKKTNDAFGEPDIMDEQRGASVVAGRMDMVIRLTKKRLQWQGRASQGKVDVDHDDNGWVKVKQGNGNEVAERVKELLSAGEMSKHKIATTIAEEFDISVSTATRRVKELEG